jgi:hypothetical protein
MGIKGRTPEERWRTLNPEASYFDGRCEVVVSYNYVHRCRHGAVVMNAHGFAVCEVHAKTLRLRDEGMPERARFVVEQFDEEAARFRFGHLAEPSPLALLVRALEAQWEF